MKIIKTDDGSDTIFSEEINETYHSRHGAVQESRHVFIKNGFRFLVSTFPKKTVKIFELGLGTGLNAVLTVIESLKFQQPVEYTAIEPYPLSKEVIDQLNYKTILDESTRDDYLMRIHTIDFEKYETLHTFFRFRKICTTIQKFDPKTEKFNLVYYDAFAPNKQPETWQRQMLQKVYDFLDNNSVFVTYCAQGQVKRDLKDIGFKLSTLQGPPGKKEMILCVKN
jgi:tRNA U34 5-methylaminomethyl-2-thiouridine-forming methyltransferase MnmC